MAWETVIGLEVHAQLATSSKIFSGASTAYGAAANSQADLVSLGYPGVLPVLNAEVVRMAARFGLAINATVAERSVFARKNYFYPDLPKGYQISQYELPIVQAGYMDIVLENSTTKRIGITRAHLEEDAGKSVHENLGGKTGVDLNRAGTPLLEIVSEPDMRSAAEAVNYLRRIHQLVRYLDICDGNMQEGSFRCDANVSVRPAGQQQLGTRTELKNLNSFRFIEKAIQFEVQRQIDVLEEGGEVVQETRLYDSDRDETRPMRSKEEANDYRYFPDPDLLPVVIDAEFLDRVRAAMPELPQARAARLQTDYGLRADEAEVLTASRPFADYYEAAVAAGADPKLAANWSTGELNAALNREGLEIDAARVPPAALAQLLERIRDNTISGKIAKDVFASMWQSGESADQIIAAQGLQQITDTAELETLVDQVLADNPAQVEQFRAGKEKVLGYLVGQVMRATQGKANPGQVNQLLRDRLRAGS